jgi:hypothetical protein
MKNSILLTLTVLFAAATAAQPQTERILEKDGRFDWIQTARIFLMDAYQPPFAPKLEYDAGAFAETMADMNANVIRFGTMGKYATIQGIRFRVHPDQGKRDLLQETIDACKPKGIRVIPYISTGHKLAWSMVTEDYPEYARKMTPGGLPDRSHMYVGEDHGTVCWMGPYRQAYLDYVEHVVRDYDIDALYFDAWIPHYFWEGNRLCYCDGCRNGFRAAHGLEIPYHGREQDYTASEKEIIGKYNKWYEDVYIREVLLKVRELVKLHKDIPLISNINNPERMASLHPAIINSMDAFLYERGHSMLERAEGVSVPRSVGLHVWPYVGTYHNWPRLAFQGLNYQQEIFTNLMFGGGSVIAQPTGYLYQSDNREYVRYPFGLIKKFGKELEGLENYPYVGVLFAYESPKAHIRSSGLHGAVNARTSTLGAFSALLYGHTQVSSVSEFVLDNPALLEKYPVLYLANVPQLSAGRIKNIRDYVQGGGCLVASYAATLFQPDGSRGERFGLEDLFQVRPLQPAGKLKELTDSYQAMIGGPNDLYLKPRNGSGLGDADQLYPLFYYEPVEVLRDAEVLMDIVTGPDRQAILPGVVMSKHGKGRVIYCASALESLYHSEGPDVVGKLIGQLVQKVVPQAAPYSLDGPASLLSNLTAKENSLVLHLTNWTGNKFEHPWRNEYELSPAENVRLQIRIPDNKRIKKVSTLVEADYRKKLRGQNLEIFFPRIEAYQAVLVEFE